MSYDSDIALAAAQSAAASATTAATSAAYAVEQVGLIGSGGSSSLTVVSGGTVDLDNTKPNGYLIGYRVTATTTIEGVAFPAGSYIFERDSGVYGGWTYRTLDQGSVVVPAPDVTAPTVGTLAGSAIGETGFTLTVSGAADETALAPAPYAFSTDNGSTWTAYQSSNVLAVTGKTASTAYQCKHRTKDAAGNVSTGAMVTVTTSAADIAPGWTVADTFTAADATVLNGRVTEKGAKTWVSPNSWDGGGSAEAATITSNGVANTNTGALSTQGARINFGAGNVEVEVNYDVSSGVDASANKQVIVHVASASSTDFLAIQVRAGGALVCLKGGAVEPVLSGVKTGLPSTGTINVKLVGNDITVTHPAGVATVTVTPGSAPGWTNTGAYCGVSARSRTAKFDTFKARVPA